MDYVVSLELPNELSFRGRKRRPNDNRSHMMTAVVPSLQNLKNKKTL